MHEADPAWYATQVALNNPPMGLIHGVLNDLKFVEVDEKRAVNATKPMVPFREAPILPVVRGRTADIVHQIKK